MSDRKEFLKQVAGAIVVVAIPKGMLKDAPVETEESAGGYDIALANSRGELSYTSYARMRLTNNMNVVSFPVKTDRWPVEVDRVRVLDGDVLLAELPFEDDRIYHLQNGDALTLSLRMEFE